MHLTLTTLNSQFGRLRVLSENELKNRSPYNHAGIKNLGAICYMLSVIQQFYMNKSFRNLVLRVDDGQQEQLVEKDGRQVDDNLLHQLQRLFSFLTKTERMDYNPQDFCYSWKGYDGQPVNVLMQQDAQEFTSMLLDRLEKSMKDTPFRRVVECNYTGKVSNLLTCEKCQKSKVREEDFYCLTLEVKNYKLLSESLGKLVHGEIINDYQCDFCNQKADVVKKTVISKCPNNLILHLQRNVFNLDTFVNEKISTKFEFPHSLDLKPYSLEAILPSAVQKT
jgi:ubiquitin carboxyl-terminal hydrolase 34